MKLNRLSQGASLGGTYRVDQWMRDEDTGTFFMVSNEAGGKLLAKVAPESGEQLAAWERARGIDHPHLLQVRDAGRADMAGEPCIYAIFEYPDDALATGLEHGSLSEPETRAVLEAARSALRCLHGQGFVHGAVNVEHVVAVGDTVKLTTDTLRQSDDGEGQAEDIRRVDEMARRLGAPEKQESRTPPAFPKWIIAGVALLLLVILALNLRKKPDRPRAPAIAPPQTAIAEASQPLKPSPMSGLWHVIAFTYRSPEMAAKKAKQINDRWPELHAAVFAPLQLHGYYLVALGDGMRRADATRIQQRARTLGLPRDTFVQNYNE